MCDERLFQPQMIKLKSLGYDCSFFAPDTQASIPEMARDILSSYNGPVFIIGLSMGGIIALEIALQAPKRVKGLAILNSTHKGKSATALFVSSSVSLLDAYIKPTSALRRARQ